MRFISLGECNRNMFYILIGGISKIVVNLILYLFPEEAELNKHTFILGINAGFGMSLALFPYIYINKYTNIQEKENAQEKINEKNDSYKITTNNTKYFDDIFKKRNPILKRDKYLTLFLCAFLDFTQKILVFLFSHNITNNFWIFNIVFLNVFTSLITKNQLYKHQYFSISIMILFGLCLNVINLYKIKLEDIPMVILSIFIEIIYSLGIVLAKYSMDDLFCSPFEVTFYEGIFSLILNAIFLIIATNIPIQNEKVSFFKELFKVIEYEGKYYLENFYNYIEVLNYKEVLLFIVTMLGRVLFNLFSHIIIKYFTSSHVVIILIMGEISLDWTDKDIFEIIITIIIFIVEFLMILVFCEIIEINSCGFEINTRKNIEKRAKSAVFDEGDNGSIYTRECEDEIEMTSDNNNNNSFNSHNSII